MPITTTPHQVTSPAEHIPDRNGYFQTAGLTNSGLSGGTIGYDDGIAVSAWRNFTAGIRDAWAKGQYGQEQKIHVIGSPYQTPSDYAIGNEWISPFNFTDETSYTGFGTHRDRMVRAAGGVYIDEAGNTAYGVAMGAEVSVGSEPFSNLEYVHLPTPHFVSTPNEESLANIIAANADIISQSNGSKMVDDSLLEYSIVTYFQADSNIKEKTFYCKSASNSTKDSPIIHAEPFDMIEKGFKENMFIVTGLDAGNAPATDDLADCTICMPYNNQGISGTSHATAMFSGVLAIYKQWVERTHGINDTTMKKVREGIFAACNDKFQGYDRLKHGHGYLELDVLFANF